MADLIAYFSRSGENYINGEIKNLDIGNTETVACMIEKITEAKLFKIDPMIAYSKDYSQCLEEAQDDKKRNARPALKTMPPDMKEYNVIYLGFPIFWGTMPMPVFTFLEGCDLKNKRIRPFCTHAGSGFDESIADIKKICPDAVIGKGLELNGAAVQVAQEVIEQWVKEK